MPEIHLLTAGYIVRGEDNRVGSSVSLIRADGALIVVDPGMVSSTSVITDALSGLGHQPEDVTDVIISHHHPDHTMNIALFPAAAVHDHWAVYRGDIWHSRPAEGFQVAPGVGLWETPGHTEQDITTLVKTDDGVVAFTHLWFSEDGPAEDPVAVDPEALHLGRRRVLEAASVIVPGHGPAFVPGPDTPR
jgi:glyoxylase-like metal-dependent hydrolase (beta-lactamase superfamily II)